MDSNCAFCGTKDDSVLGTYLKIPMKYGGVDSAENRITLCGSCKRNFESEFTNEVWEMVSQEGPTWRVSGDDAEVAVLEVFHRRDFDTENGVSYSDIVDAVGEEFGLDVDPTQVGLVMSEYEVDTEKKWDGTYVVDPDVDVKLPRGFPDVGNAQVSMSVPGLNRGEVKDA